jgi:ATPase subunit of ABC transporter with duplicated ATPase domains
MRIPEFTITNIRNIRLAHWKALPPIMIITGPNGCGKSTLLNNLRNVGGESHILYLGPHRSSRRQTVRMRFLSQQVIEMSSLLSTTSLPGFEGLDIPNRIRDAWNSDEASSYLKYSLCQIELDRQAALTDRFDNEGAISKEQFGEDVWEPLRKLTANLLPHLRFNKIDVSNRDQVQCFFSVHSVEVKVDLDDLSSGEKAIIQLFYPLIEHQVKQNIEAIRTGARSSRSHATSRC